MPGNGRRGMSPFWIALLIGVCLPAVLPQLAHGSSGETAGSSAAAPITATPGYTITIPPDPGQPVEIVLTIASPPPRLELFFDPAGRSGGQQRLEAISAHRGDGTVLPVERLANGGFRVDTQGAAAVTVTYRLNLSPSLWSPATWPGRELASVRVEDVVWLVGRDTLLHVAGADQRPKEVRLHLPAGWRAYQGGVGLVDVQRPLSVASGEEPLLLLGRFEISRYPVPGGQLTLVVSANPPWEPGQLAWSVQVVLERLMSKGIRVSPADLTLVVLRYPGALRLNPLIGSQLAGGHTIVHWVGTGTLTWWRKHAARDVVAWALERTLRLAPDARWLQAGMAEYGALTLLFDTGLLTVDDMYQSLRALHSNGLHYSGPAWPSVVAAALESPPSHAGERVLAFRAPLVTMLLDLQLHAASGGTADVFDLWARLVAAQQEGPPVTLFTAAVLAPLAELGLPADFTQNYIYGTRLPPADFDRLFEQWFEQHAR